MADPTDTECLTPLRPRCRGDLVVVVNESVRRVVVVTASAEQHLVATLCSSALDMATEHDVVLSHPLLCPLVIETGCPLVVLRSQVCAHLGTIDLDAVNVAREQPGTATARVTVTVACPDPTEHTVDALVVAGRPLCGATDPRWRFMERELDDVVVLRDPAHRVIFDDGWNPGRRAASTELTAGN
jgi:hypothetical protein